jgi:hypothetical protein
MKNTGFPILLILLVSQFVSISDAQVKLSRNDFQLAFGPSLYLNEEDTGWGFGVSAAMALDELASPRNFVGLEISYLQNDFKTGSINRDETDLLFLVDYRWYTPDLVSGRVQPYLSFGGGNMVVDFDETNLVTGVVTSDTDPINPTLAFEAGVDFAFTRVFAMNLSYRPIWVFDIDRVTTDNMVLHGFHLGGIFSW